MLLGLLIIGFSVYLSLRKHFGLLLIHAGCVLVLAGGMYGSEKGHVASEFAAKISGRFMAWLRPSQDGNESSPSPQHRSFTNGSISLHPGESSNQVGVEASGEICYLPFSIRLEDAYIEYYDDPVIRMYFNDGVSFDIPATAEEAYHAPDHRGIVQITKIYGNFKMKRQNDQMVPYDSPDPGLNRAYELIYTPKAGNPEPFFVFERFPMHGMPGQSLRAEYIAPRMVKDYKSVLQVIDAGNPVKESTIEVNKPLYYGGYHFYQNTFGYDQFGPISGIHVSSARGVWIVFGGYAMIFVGLVLQLWPKLFKKQNSPKAGERVITENSKGQMQ